MIPTPDRTGHTFKNIMELGKKNQNSVIKRINVNLLILSRFKKITLL